jgi:16S rRNA (guanine966-N2)-methyltransferase
MSLIKNSLKIDSMVLLPSLKDLYVSPKTRPVTSKLRRQVFDILPSLEGFAVLDLFCGSGILGIEALWRGAACLTAVDNDLQTCRALYRFAKLKNLDASIRNSRNGPPKNRLSENKCVEVFWADACKVHFEVCYDLVFVDPPYDCGLCEPALNNVRKALAAQTIVVVKSSARETTVPSWAERVRKAVHGDSVLSFLKLCDNSGE